jgi:hypothetical protein
LEGDVMRALILPLVLILAGCQRDPYTSVYTTAQPRSNDLVGSYFPDVDTVALISKEGHYKTVSPSITLMNDGTIVITNIPDWWLTRSGEPGGGFDSGRGTWTVEKHQDWWAIGVGFDDTAQFSLLNRQPGGFATQMMLIGEKPPYRIHLTIGDPDAGMGMQFEEAPPQKGESVQ